MKKATCLLFVLLIATSIMSGSSCTSSHVWAAFYDIDPADSITDYNCDTVVKIAEDSAGNVLFAGNSAIIKYDSRGNEIWAINKDGINAMTLDGSDNIYTTGYSGEERDLSDYAFCTTKYDTDGNQIWEAVFDGQEDNQDEAAAIAVDESGNVYVTGKTRTDNGASYDYATVKYDSAGNQVWVATYHRQEGIRQYPSQITLDGNGDVYVTGLGYYTVDPETTSKVDYITIKYDGITGSEVWVSFLNIRHIDRPSRIIPDNSGNIYVGGRFGAVKYNSQGEQIWISDQYPEDRVWDIAVDESDNFWLVQSQSIGENIFNENISKYDADGNELWQTSDYDFYPRYADIDDYGNIYVTGSRCTREDSNDYLECVTAAFDSDGQIIWVADYQKSGSDETRGDSIVVSSSGTVYVAASTSKGYAILAYPCE